MLVSPLICENLRAFFTPKSCIIEHVPDQINYSYFLELISAMRTMAIAPGLPFIDAALAGKNLALTTAYHVLHNVSTDRADELFNLLTVLVNHVIGSQSLCRACYFLLGDTLYHCPYVLHKFYCALFCLLSLFCHWRDPDPR